jgi:hypothetical protein
MTVAHQVIKDANLKNAIFMSQKLETIAIGIV